MNQWIFAFLAVLSYDFTSAFINVYPKLKSYPVQADEDVGDPLFLSPLIESGKIDLARKKAMVQHKEMNDISSYAGYLTVNKIYNSNIYFWFFPSKVIIFIIIYKFHFIFDFTYSLDNYK
jgi:vitellogenic carboxypeptidase-like protein